MDESHENRLRIGINGLAQYLWRGPRDALGPASNLRTVLSTLHWSQLALETGSFSQSQLFFFPPPHISTHTPTCSCTAREHSMGYGALLDLKKEMTSCSLFVYLGCLSLMNHIPLLAALLSLSDLHPGEE